MPELARRPADTKADEILAIVTRDGAMILEDVLGPQQMRQIDGGPGG